MLNRSYLVGVLILNVFVVMPLLLLRDTLNRVGKECTGYPSRILLNHLGSSNISLLLPTVEYMYICSGERSSLLEGIYDSLPVLFVILISHRSVVSLLSMSSTYPPCVVLVYSSERSMTSV